MSGDSTDRPIIKSTRNGSILYPKGTTTEAAHEEHKLTAKVTSPQYNQDSISSSTRAYKKPSDSTTSTPAPHQPLSTESYITATEEDEDEQKEYTQPENKEDDFDWKLSRVRVVLW